MLKNIIFLNLITIKLLANNTSFFNQKNTVNNQEIIRSIPIINNIPTEGIDSVFINNQQTPLFLSQQNFNVSNEFIISAAEALEVAIKISPHSLIHDPYVEKISDAIYEKVWLMHFGELKAAYKVRLPTLSVIDLQDVYVNAQNAEILKIEPTVHLVSAVADVFVYSPSNQHIDFNELKRVTLENLIDIKEDSFLNAEYISVKNCCHYYTCPSDKNCAENEKKCALKSHKNARQRREIIELSTDSMGLNKNIAVAPSIFIDTLRCTYLPFAKSSIKDNKIGFFDVPIDEEGPASEMDKFSEIQAYFSANSFFQHIRFLLSNNSWCLREHAMSCDSQGRAQTPYKIFVNQMIPDLYGQNDLISQIAQSKGTKENPVILNDLVRMGNAAFVPALSTLKKNTPKSDEILSDLIQNFDHNVFFQGNKDFAYDGDVVFHEFMHAVTASLVGKLNSLGIDQWGINSEPGSLNEGWSDYFAASFSKDSSLGEYASLKDGYGEVGLRNINNSFSCPNSIIGEIHNDSQIWSGALWEIRQAIVKNFSEEKAVSFDKAVLASLALSKNTEDFKTQSQKLLSTVEKDVFDITQEILTKRGVINCFRAVTVSKLDNKNTPQISTKKILFIPSKNNIGLKNYAPASLQLKIEIPAGAVGVDISFKQFFAASGALMGEETTANNASGIKPIAALYSFDEPHKWSFKGASANSVNNEKEEEIISYYENGLWHLYKQINLEKCEQKNAYISFLGRDNQYTLKDINISFIIDKNINSQSCKYFYKKNEKTKNESGCSSTGNNNLFFMLFIFLMIRLGIKNYCIKIAI